MTEEVATAVSGSAGKHRGLRAPASADGYTVAFMSGALPIGFGLGFGDSGREGPSNLYVANMRPGSRAIRRLRH